MEKTSNRFTVRRLAVTGLLSALVFVFSWIQIPIGEVARIHLGNVFCALSGLLFGPLTGGLASGFGSMLFDFTNPLYIAESWITFITKFFIGFLAGLIAHRSGNISLGRDVLGASVGSVTYVAPVSYTHLRAHETGRNLVCRLLLEKKKKKKENKQKKKTTNNKKKKQKEHKRQAERADKKAEQRRGHDE